ncbi:MAG: hypothetical protein A2939_00760 [Parcubacteria group bacterium RIFCSPLOWO2_01_FULL_48_18]|nr:MAG: hypothetical protein A3J67_01555 [Parcubacteria group bacterium RIFCSPHIGHO2_02_FULL_48_10b]OHB22007.1 MAG: hypothetical protein A2939_00760 [Parcubacteria group bacterium RIFCSPLOWO2_01_FULL_48_18]
MSYLDYIVVGIVGFVLGVLCTRAFFAIKKKVELKRSQGFVRQKREEAKDFIMAFLKANEEITVEDVSESLKTPEEAAVNLLYDLEKEGRVMRHGKRGKDEFYTLKDVPAP